MQYCFEDGLGHEGRREIVRKGYRRISRKEHCMVEEEREH